MEQIPQQKVKVSVSCSVMSETLQSHGLGPTRLICLQNSLINDTEVGCHFLFWGIFLTQGSNPDLPHCRKILYYLNYQESTQQKGQTLSAQSLE